jgi:lipopolysaccharide transport system permease protein
MNNTSENEWTMIIRPKRHIFEINFKEIWRYRDLILLFVRRDFVSKYKQTILGPLWFIIQPLISTFIYTIVFGQIAGISTEGLPQILFYMSGIVAWNYFSSCLNSTSSTFVSNAGIFGKVYFPRLSVPISVVISNLFQFGIQLLLLLGFLVFFLFKGDNVTPNITILLMPVLLINMAAFGLGLGIIISSMTTKYRDLTNLVSFGVQLWMYATPVIYPISQVPERFQNILRLNPVTPIVEVFRYSLIGGTFNDWNYLYYSFGVTIIILLIGIVMFNKVEQSFMDTV